MKIYDFTKSKGKKIILILFWFFIISAYLLLIFMMSSENGVQSHWFSTNIVNFLKQNLGFLRPLKQGTLLHAINSDYLLRKIAHFTEYFILSCILYNAFAVFKAKSETRKKFSVLFCFLYALTDEYHQLFIPGRTSLFADVLIDTSGALAAVFVIHVIQSLFKKPQPS